MLSEAFYPLDFITKKTCVAVQPSSLYQYCGLVYLKEADKSVRTLLPNLIVGFSSHRMCPFRPQLLSVRFHLTRIETSFPTTRWFSNFESSNFLLLRILFVILWM
ncbi:hypothetical protein CEXT_589021 [Caerostris extrusa]|uniref:Uncharacterized protein n=1 Tax=Caerostris extrusa TaxID=172846 RepID=A0AAV4TNS3_CAEEX|nr:hypothetical protein CEXT_589021 [Caerostris extrusa]